MFVYLRFSYLPPRHSERVLEGETGALRKRYLEYVEGARQYLEGETDKDNTLLQIKTHFCEFVRKLIASFSRKLLRFYLDVLLVLVLLLQ